MAETLNFTDPASYRQAVEWVRGNVVLKNNVKGAVLQLDVAFPQDKVTVFMNPKNHYILAFQGADGIYILDDPHSIQFQKDLEATLKGSKTTILKGFSGSHGYGGIQTFAPKVSIRDRNFKLRHIAEVRHLSQYVAKGAYEPLRKPLSLLVCMVAESARFPMMQRDFERMYFGSEVLADEAVQSFRTAQALREQALTAFPEYRSPEAVAKLVNRATELEELLKRLEALRKTASRQELITSILAGGKQIVGSPSVEDTNRFRELCKELSLTTSRQVTTLVTQCKNQMAVRGAKEGVALPGIDG